jgi:hypothetical protein
MMVSQVVRNEIAMRFDAAETAIILRAFESTALPLLDAPHMAGDLIRVHRAILKLGDGDVGRVMIALGQAAVDWRDVLVAAGM